MNKIQSLKNWTIILFSLALFLRGEAQSQKVPGIVVAHSPAQTHKYIGSPSICILANGDYLASHDFFGPKEEFKVTIVYKSKDKGDTWEKISEIEEQFWSNLFLHNQLLYIMGTNGQDGNLVIRRSTDGGKTWTVPEDENRGLLAEGRYHTAPVPVILHNGRIWRAVEYRPQKKSPGPNHEPLIVSAPADSDLLKRSSWQFSNKVSQNKQWINGHFRTWREGNAVVTPDGKVAVIMRMQVLEKPGFHGQAAWLSVSEDGKKISFNEHYSKMPGAIGKKFTIRYDNVSQRYWSLVNRY